MGSRLSGMRVLVTSADTYMGPPIAELFAGEGAEVIADTLLCQRKVVQDDKLERQVGRAVGSPCE